MAKKTMSAQLEEARIETARARDLIEQAKAEMRNAEKALQQQHEENNKLRRIIHDLELRQANLEGYLRRMKEDTEDRQPKILNVTHTKEPDYTDGFYEPRRPDDWHTDRNGNAKKWYER